MAEFGSWIRSMRKARRWTQEELSARSGISQSFISALETGARKHPGIENLSALAKAFGMPAEEVLKKVGYAKLEKTPRKTATTRGDALIVPAALEDRDAPDIHNC